MLEAEYRVALVWYGVGGVESSAQWLVEPLLPKLPYSMRVYPHIPIRVCVRSKDEGAACELHGVEACV